jgi:hypothetical protein
MDTRDQEQFQTCTLIIDSALKTSEHFHSPVYYVAFLGEHGECHFRRGIYTFYPIGQDYDSIVRGSIAPRAFCLAFELELLEHLPQSPKLFANLPSVSCRRALCLGNYGR